MRDAIAWASPRIGRADAEYLLASQLGLTRAELNRSGSLTDADRQRFGQHVAEVAAGRPVEYVLRQAVFMDFTLYVDERVLIPRSETEELVGRALALLASMTRNQTTVPGHLPEPGVLDLGTGSGAIAIALARALPNARVSASDISPAALAVAVQNLRRLELEERVTLVQSDLFQAFRPGPTFDLIVANLPYVPSGMWQELPLAVRAHEPRLALDGGPDGMRFLRPVLNQAESFLKPGGLLALEIDPAVSPTIRREFPRVEIARDLFGLERYAFVRRSS
jgi:release factor glutamine methyltransferase